MDNNLYVTSETAVYSADHVRTVLALGKTKTYDFLQQVYETQSPFRVIKVGKLFRIPKQPFDNWLFGDDRN